MNQIPQSSTDKGCLGCPCLQVCSDRQDWCSLYDERPKGLNPLPICIQERPQIVVAEALEARLKGAEESVNELSRHCQDLEDHLDLCRDEFKRILSCPGVDPEIIGLAERGYKNITQHVHVITQRDDALTKVATLESRLEKTEEALKNIKTFADERAECSVYLANIAWACNEILKGLGKEVKEDEPTGD